MQKLATKLETPPTGLIDLPIYLEKKAARENFMDWSVAKILDTFFPHLKLRHVVRKSELFSKTTLHRLASTPSGLASFLLECRMVPHCGDTQIKLLHEVLVSLINLVQTSAGEGGFGDAARNPGTPGLQEAQSQPREMVTYPAEGVFHPCFGEHLQPLYHKIWNNPLDMPFVYIPVSVPEFAKTSAILSAETGTFLGQNSNPVHMDAMHDAVDGMSQAKGAIILDSHALYAIFARKGRYQSLTKQDVALQRIMLQGMLAVLPEDIDCVVIDRASALLAPGGIIGTDVIIHGFGGYTLYSCPAFLDHIQTLCNDALRNGEKLCDFLKLT
jgi:hypothetical protein